MARTVVIGGGAAGIAAARTLHDAGHDVLLVEASDRLGGSVALHYQAASHGTQLLRVHDVAENRQALRIWRGLRDAALVG